jgi:hypothetical protein
MDKPEEYILDNEIPTISFIRIGQSLGMAGEMVNGEMVNGEMVNGEIVKEEPKEEPKEKSVIESNNGKK